MKKNLKTRDYLSEEENQLLNKCGEDILHQRNVMKAQFAGRTEIGSKYEIRVGYVGRKSLIKTIIKKIEK